MRDSMDDYPSQSSATAWIMPMITVLAALIVGLLAGVMLGFLVWSGSKETVLVPQQMSNEEIDALCSPYVDEAVGEAAAGDARSAHHPYQADRTAGPGSQQEAAEVDSLDPSLSHIDPEAVDLDRALSEQGIPVVVGLSIPVEDHVPIRQHSRVEGGVGQDVEGAVPAIPEGLGVVTGLVPGPFVFFRGASRGVDQGTASVEDGAKGSVASGALPRGVRCGAGRPRVTLAVEVDRPGGFGGVHLDLVLVDLQLDRSFRVQDRGVERERGDVDGLAHESSLPPIEAEFDPRRFQDFSLGQDADPVATVADRRVGGDEVDLANRGRDGAGVEEVEQRGPVDAARAGLVGAIPPVTGSGLFVESPVAVKGPENLRHLPGLVDRHVVIRVTVQDVDAMIPVVRRQREGVRAGGRPEQEMVPEATGHLEATHRSDRRPRVRVALRYPV